MSPNFWRPASLAVMALGAAASWWIVISAVLGAINIYHFFHA